MKILPAVIFLVTLNTHSLLFAKSSDKSIQWKLYVSTTFGFSVEYPELAEVKEYMQPSMDWGAPSGVWFRVDRNSSPNLDIEVYLNKRNLSVQQFWKEESIGGPEDPTDPNRPKCSKDKPIKINNAKGFHGFCTSKWYVTKDLTKEHKEEYFYFSNPPFIITFSVDWPVLKTEPPDRRPSLKAGMAIDRRMIDSFRFLQEDKKRNVAP